MRASTPSVGDRSFRVLRNRLTQQQLGNAVEEVHLPMEVEQPQQQLDNAEILAVEHNLMQPADKMHQNQGFALHQPLANDIIMPDIVWDEEIPRDQLVVPGEEDPQENPEEPEPPVQNQESPAQNLNVGMALIEGPAIDPAYLDWERRKATEAIKIWDSLTHKGMSGDLTISIPMEWANFFTALLLSQRASCGPGTSYPPRLLVCWIVSTPLVCWIVSTPPQLCHYK